jgi:ATP-dependent Clp protease ATP-binding subunit ClpC
MNENPEIKDLLLSSESAARALGHSYLGVEHIILTGLEKGTFSPFLSTANISVQALEQAIKDLLPKEKNSSISAKLPYTPRLKKVMERALEKAYHKSDHSFIPQDLFTAILEEKSGIVALALTELKVSPELLLQGSVVSDSSPVKEEKKKTVKTPTLDKLGRNLTQLAEEQKLEPVIGRNEELRRVIQILTRKTKNVPLLIGEPGVGKTAVVMALAERIYHRAVPGTLLDKKLIELPISSILAGTAHRGELEEKVQKILLEAAHNPDVILFMDEIHQLIGAGSSGGGLDIGNMLKPALADGSIKLIGATTTSEYQKYLLKDPAFERRVQPILVSEPSYEETLQILHGLKPRYEKFHGVNFESEVIEQAIRLSIRYLPDRHLPDKALDLLDEAASKVKMKTLAGLSPTVTKEDIAETVSAWTGIPVHKLSEDEKEKLLQLEEKLKMKIVGQDETISKISEVIRISRAGLGNPGKPVGVFLFLGPTGVGKTEMAKTLAEFLYGSVNLMIRLDMSEYKEKHSISKLIGAPPGYVGYEEEGTLTKAVRAKPYSLILMDEVEKAHPEVLDLFLQIFDDGRLTDSKGRTVHFNNALMIMTSNLGAEQIMEGIAKKADREEIRSHILEIVKSSFRPEFINRIDEILIFNPLTEKNLEQIVFLQIQDLKNRLQEQKLNLDITPALTKHLIQNGFDPVFGARPLKRAIQQILAKRIAQALLEGKFSEGETIQADFQDERVILQQGESS